MSLGVPETIVGSLLLIMMCVSCSVSFESFLRACLHGGGRPQMDEVTCGGSPHLSCKRENERLYGQVGYTT